MIRLVEEDDEAGDLQELVRVCRLTNGAENEASRLRVDVLRPGGADLVVHLLLAQRRRPRLVRHLAVRWIDDAARVLLALPLAPGDFLFDSARHPRIFEAAPAADQRAPRPMDVRLTISRSRTSPWRGSGSLRNQYHGHERRGGQYRCRDA